MKFEVKAGSPAHYKTQALVACIEGDENDHNTFDGIHHFIREAAAGDAFHKQLVDTNLGNREALIVTAESPAHFDHVIFVVDKRTQNGLAEVIYTALKEADEQGIKEVVISDQLRPNLPGQLLIEECAKAGEKFKRNFPDSSIKEVTWLIDDTHLRKQLTKRFEE